MASGAAFQRSRLHLVARRVRGTVVFMRHTRDLKMAFALLAGVAVLGLSVGQARGMGASHLILAHPRLPLASTTETPAEQCAAIVWWGRAGCERRVEEAERRRIEQEVERGKYENIPGGEKVEVKSLVGALHVRARQVGRFSPAEMTIRARGFRRRAVFGDLPPLSDVSLSLSPRIQIDTRGLRACNLARLQPSSTQGAMRACGPAEIGTGAMVRIYEDSESVFSFTERIVLFNGRYKGGRAIFAYGSESARGVLKLPPPSPPTVFRIERIGGTHGITLVGDISYPNIEARVRVVELRLSMGRTFEFKGKERNFLRAACPAVTEPTRDFTFAHGTFYFGEGVEAATGPLRGECSSQS
jgi:hypothetical protein